MTGTVLNTAQAIYATTYGTGPFHPAIRNGREVYYWPNVTFRDENAAYAKACETLADAQEAFNAVVRGWNIYKV